MSEFSTACREVFLKNGLDNYISPEILEQFEHLTVRLLAVNAKMNLTAITDPTEIMVKHYADSLLIADRIPQGAKLLDVGCGGGFPCLPIAISRPDLSVYALDSTAKKLEFVRETADFLGIRSFFVLCGRAEALSAPRQEGKSPTEFNYRAFFDAVCARAVARLPVLSELCLPFLRVGGIFVAMKGADGAQEADEAKGAIQKLGAKLTESREILLRGLDEEQKRILLILQKMAKTPSQYPRDYAKIKKKPL